MFKMFIPQFCLVHTLNFREEWFDVYPGWIYGQYERDLFGVVRRTGKIRVFRGDTEALTEVEYYQDRVSSHYYCYLSEWRVMMDDLLKDNVKRGLSNEAIESLDRIIKMFHNEEIS